MTAAHQLLRHLCWCDTGSSGIGHVRYPTAGTPSAHEAQPFFVNSPLGIYLIHNGNLTNTEHLRTLLNGSHSFFNRHMRTGSDSEVPPPPPLLFSLPSHLSLHAKPPLDILDLLSPSTALFSGCGCPWLTQHQLTAQGGDVTFFNLLCCQYGHCSLASPDLISFTFLLMWIQTGT